MPEAHVRGQILGAIRVATGSTLDEIGGVEMGGPIKFGHGEKFRELRNQEGRLCHSRTSGTLADAHG